MGIKLFVFFLCTSGFLYQTWSFLQIYLAYPTTLKISEEYPDTFIAPAITVCNRNRLLRQPYCKAYPEKCTWKHTRWRSFCYRYNRMCPIIEPPDFIFGIPIPHYLLKPNRSVDFLDDVAPFEESNIVKYASSSAGRVLNSEVRMTYFQNHGLPYRCFTIPSLNAKTNEPIMASRNGGYTVHLDLRPEEYFNTYDSVQASIVLHDPRKLVNPMTEGITLTSGKWYRFHLTMERKESLPPPYASNCKDYLTNWNKEGGKGPVAKDDCISQCKINLNLQAFGCLEQTMTYSTFSYPICENQSYESSSQIYRKCNAYCQDACEENFYHITLDEVIGPTGIMCRPWDENCQSRILKFYVYFDRLKIKKFKQIPRFESIELFSYIGGYLVLWMGISLASVFDLAQMMYDVINNAFLKKARNKKRITQIEHFQHHTAVNT